MKNKISSKYEKSKIYSIRTSSTKMGVVAKVMGMYHVGGEKLPWKFYEKLRGALQDETVQNEALQGAMLLGGILQGETLHHDTVTRRNITQGDINCRQHRGRQCAVHW